MGKGGMRGVWGGGLAAEEGWGWRGDGGALHWFNATAKAAVKGGLPFFPRPVRRRDPTSACQGQVTFLIHTLGLWTLTMHTHSSFVLCMHTASRQPLRHRLRWGPLFKVETLIFLPLAALLHRGSQTRKKISQFHLPI